MLSCSHSVSCIRCDVPFVTRSICWGTTEYLLNWTQDLRKHLTGPRIRAARTRTTYSSPSSSSFNSPRYSAGIYGGANGSNFLPSFPSAARRSSAPASKCGVGRCGLFCSAGHRRISHWRRGASGRRMAHGRGGTHAPRRRTRRACGSWTGRRAGRRTAAPARTPRGASR